MKDLLLGVGLLSCPALIFGLFGTSGMEVFDASSDPRRSVGAVNSGRIAFASECAQCHGRLARGTRHGPDLIAPAYGPAIASDDRIRRAVRNGVATADGRLAMAAVPGVSERDLARMIAFLREMQRVNGIR